MPQPTSSKDGLPPIYAKYDGKRLANGMVMFLNPEIYLQSLMARAMKPNRRCNFLELSCFYRADGKRNPFFIA
jgi:hypothetical protein